MKADPKIRHKIRFAKEKAALVSPEDIIETKLARRKGNTSKPTHTNKDQKGEVMCREPNLRDQMQDLLQF